MAIYNKQLCDSGYPVMSKILLALAFLFLSSSCFAFGNHQIFMSGGVVPIGDGSVDSYHEGFDNSSDGSSLSSLSDWNVYMDSVDDDRLQLADGAEDYLFYNYVDSGDLNTQYIALYGSSVITDDQCGIIQVRDVDQSVGDVGVALVFRAQSASSGPLYAVRISMADGGAAQVKWRHCTAVDATCTAIDQSSASYTITDYHYVGFAVKGSGASTYAYFWDFDDSPPSGCPLNCPLWNGIETAAGGGNWGDYTWKSANDPTDILGEDKSIDSGKNVGLYVLTGTSTVNNRWDNWFAGDIND